MMSDWSRVDLDAKMRGSVEDILRKRGDLMDTWEVVRRKNRKGDALVFNDLEESWTEGMVHGQPIAVGDGTYFLISWVGEVEDIERRVYLPCWMGPSGHIDRFPLNQDGVDELFTSQNEAMSVLLDMASADAAARTVQESGHTRVTFDLDQELYEDMTS